MQPIGVLHFLRTKEAKLHDKLEKTRKQDMTLENKLVITNLLLTESCCRLLKGISNFLWVLHLLKTSIFITKTPLTTLKSLLKPMMHKGEKALDKFFSFLHHPYEPKGKPIIKIHGEIRISRNHCKLQEWLVESLL